MKVSEKKNSKTPMALHKENKVAEAQALDAVNIIWEVAAEEVNLAVHADAVAQENMIRSHLDKPIFLIFLINASADEDEMPDT